MIPMVVGVDSTKFLTMKGGISTMKSEYMIPDVNVIQFETEDVLNASGGLNYGGNVTCSTKKKYGGVALRPRCFYVKSSKNGV